MEKIVAKFRQALRFIVRPTRIAAKSQKVEILPREFFEEMKRGRNIWYAFMYGLHESPHDARFPHKLMLLAASISASILSRG